MGHIDDPNIYEARDRAAEAVLNVLHILMTNGAHGGTGILHIHAWAFLYVLGMADETPAQAAAKFGFNRQYAHQIAKKYYQALTHD